MTFNTNTYNDISAIEKCKLSISKSIKMQMYNGKKSHCLQILLYLIDCHSKSDPAQTWYQYHFRQDKVDPLRRILEHF